MRARILYVFVRGHDDGGPRIMSSEDLDTDLCKRAELVVSYDHDRFHVIKDRYRLAGMVPLKELL